MLRTNDGELEGLKEFIRFGWEVGRKWLSHLSGVEEMEKGKGKAKEGAEEKEKEVKVQMVVIVDLDGAGMSNLVSWLLCSG